MNYEYVSNPEEQYDWSEVADKARIEPIEAKYVKSVAPMDQGNCFIEALPLPLREEEIPNAYTVIPSYIGIEDGDDKNTIFYKVSLLREIRFPFPFHRSLERAFYTSLITSYRSRRIRRDSYQRLTYRTGGKESVTHQILEAETESSTNPSFHMLGFSGCGKSSALKILLSRIPQYIRHKTADGGYFPQITYLVVSCTANSNFNGIYAGIGRALDRALGILDSSQSYEDYVKKARGLVAKENMIAKYIELFGIGCIILDEIQLIDFTSTKENSFEGLMTLANKTKVAIIAVGTEDAYSKMFTKQRTARRLGEEIIASSYCENKKYFAMLCSHLFDIKLFGEEVVLNQDILNAMYECTAGIIDQLISLFSFMVIDYYTPSKRPKVNSSYVRKVATKHFPGILDILSDIKNPLNDSKRMELVRKSYEAMEEMQKNDDKKNYEKTLLEGGFASAVQSQGLKTMVYEAITMVSDDYNRATIEKETERVLKTKAGKNMSTKELTRKVLQNLKNKKSDKRPQRQKAPKTMDSRHQQMTNFLKDDAPIDL